MKKIEKINCKTNSCPVRKTADIVGQKWTTLIVRDLLSGAMGFAQIQKSLEGISPKVLTERLKFLESKKIISREVFPTTPPTTSYKLTKKGEGLKEVILAMASFGEKI